MSISKRMYSKTPRIEKDDETGKPMVKKGPTKAEIDVARTEDGTKAVMADGMPVNDRQMDERKDMNKRHLQEIKDMNSRHEKESGGKYDTGKTGSEMINKVEKDKKES